VYDELGERTKSTPSGAATTYGYNEAGNLISVERPEEGKTPKIEDAYAYDGNGLRASQTITGKTSYLAWDVDENPPLLLSDGTNSYIYGPNNIPVEQISNESKVFYLHDDQRGSTRLLTGSTGKTEATMTYDAYGNTIGTTGTVTTPLGYDGQYTSADTGLIYLRARVYDPKTAQFLTRDPLEAVTREPYNYAHENPTTWSDPTGLEASCVTLESQEQTRLQQLKEKATKELEGERKKFIQREEEQEEEKSLVEDVIEKGTTFITGCVAGGEAGGEIGAAFGVPEVGAVGGCLAAGSANSTLGSNPVEPWQPPP
jgi:RHS repeat-associated protein